MGMELDQRVFNWIVQKLGVFPTLDVFASPKAHKLPRYLTWEPDPLSLGRDAFLYKWDKMNYISPPVPLIPKILNKIQREGLDAILICTIPVVAPSAEPPSPGPPETPTLQADPPPNQGGANQSVPRASGGLSNYWETLSKTLSSHKLDQENLSFIAQYISQGICFTLWIHLKKICRFLFHSFH